MKKYLLFLSLFICSVSFGQNIHTRLDNPLPQSYGNIYYKTSWTSGTITSDFTTTGDIALSLSGTNLSMTCTTTGTLGQYATIGSYTDLNKWVITNTFVAQTPGAATFGSAIGTHSLINTNYDCIGHLAQDNGATKGKMVIERGDGTILASNANGSFVFSAADVVTQILNYNDTIATYTCINVTTGVSASINFAYSISSTTQFTPSFGNFAIYEVGGTQVNTLISITSNAIKNSNILLIGDSKSKGYHASAWANRASYLTNPVFPTTTIHAGGSEALFNENQEIAEILAMNPKYAILLGGSNDLRTPYSRTVAATLASYDSLYNSLTAIGVTVLAGVIPEDSTVAGVNYATGLTAFKNAVSTKYASSYIDFWTPMTTAGDNKLKASMDFGDGIHPNDAGHNAIAAAIINSGLISLPKLTDSMAIAFSGAQNAVDSSILYNSHSTVAGISQALWNQTFLRLESNKWLLNLSLGHSLDGMFMGTATADGGSISGGGYFDGTNWKSAGSTAFSSFTLGSGAIVFYLNPSVTAFSTITPLQQYTFQTIANGGASFLPSLTLPTVSTTQRMLVSGTWGVQNYGALNNEIMFENADIIGSTLTYKATGFVEAIYFQNGHLLLAAAPSGTAGATVSGLVVPADLSSTLFTFGVPATFKATTTAAPSFNIPSGTAPTSPTNGDVWYSSNTINSRVNGVTVRNGAVVGQTTLVSGTKAITITGITTGSFGFVTLVSQGGTVTTTINYAAVCTANTLTITALTSSGTTDTTDTSVINYEVYP